MFAASVLRMERLAGAYVARLEVGFVTTSLTLRILWRASLQTRAKKSANAHARKLVYAVGVVKCAMADQSMQSLSSSFSELLATARGIYSYPPFIKYTTQ